MRKITALAALLIAVFSLAGCKNSNDEEYQRPRNIETPAIYNDCRPRDRSAALNSSREALGSRRQGSPRHE